VSSYIFGTTIAINITFKNLYKLFLFCRRYLPSDFISRRLFNLYIYVYLYKRNFGKLQGATQLFLSFFFFSKTYNISYMFVLNDNLLYKLHTLPDFSLWCPHKDVEPVYNVFVKLNEWKYKFLGKGSAEFLREEYCKLLYKYKYLGLVIFKKFSFYLNTERLLKNSVLTNKFLTIPKFSSSSINKYINLNNLSEYQFFYLRKNKVYNKGRYSRNRQNYRTGVYMCLYLSVISIFGLYYSFYKFIFKFTYLWWFFIGFIGSFILPKAIKYRLYEPTTLIKKFFDLYIWYFGLLKASYSFFKKIF